MVDDDDDADEPQTVGLLGSSVPASPSGQSLGCLLRQIINVGANSLGDF